ncbi:MAG: hypothetical protein WDZ35_04550 [Crocinitomicaceae bacterium]
MNRFIILLLSLLPFSSYLQTHAPIDRIHGNWQGIDMYQDENSYDGKTFFLPNKEFMIIEGQRIKIYFYPYSKSDEFEILVSPEEIIYKLEHKKVQTAYHFTNPNCDTLVFTMHFINKSFVKMYSRVTSTNERMEVDFATVNELDIYGFNPSAIEHLFEIDTFHTELFRGFTKLSSLNFAPYDFLKFVNDEKIAVNQKSPVTFDRGYKVIRFKLNGEEEEFKVAHSEGTQSFSIIPTSRCDCDSIIIPYITVDWADRIRKDMKENRFKYE